MWVNEIENLKLDVRQSQIKSVSDCGYNIKKEAHKLEDYYINKVGV